uniref:Uncharacterized protein n=1 Tax=Chenopodium quinoa TaxID=63459 RepID=A0A803N4S9_CHEQI
MLQNWSIEKQRQRQLKREAAASNINKGRVIMNSAEECVLNYGLDNFPGVNPDDGNYNQGNPLVGLVDEFKLFINYKIAAQCTGKQDAHNKVGFGCIVQYYFKFILQAPSEKPVPRIVDAGNSEVVRKVRQVAAQFGDSKSDGILVTAAADALLTFKKDNEEGEVLYLDHLKRVPGKWGVYPRLAGWTQDKVKNAVLQDRKADDSYSNMLAAGDCYCGMFGGALTRLECRVDLVLIAVCVVHDLLCYCSVRGCYAAAVWWLLDSEKVQQAMAGSSGAHGAQGCLLGDVRELGK